MAATTTVTAGQSRLKSLEDLLREVQARRVLVGVPQSSDPRPTEPGGKTPPTNALIGYLMETGVPEKNIPARPFLVPGVAAARDRVSARLTSALRAAVAASASGASTMSAAQAVSSVMDQVGADCVSSVKKTILAGVPPPLADATVQARARRRNKQTGKLVQTAVAKNARKELKLRSSGYAPSVEFAKPLYDTRSLFNSIQYVVQVKST